MHLRLVKARSGKTIRRYAQLVTSHRREDGMPVHKVVANLGRLSDQEVANMRLALEASRKGKPLVLKEPQAAAAWTSRVLANLRYLDLAVALHLWDGWKLSELLNRLIPHQSHLVPASAVICALTLQRCVAPGSKLSAKRWFPRTALPELLDIEPGAFNNSRIHRVLEQLDQVDAELQQALPARYEHKDGTFAALFVDVSDAYFAGRGCDLAERSRTKEGLPNRHKVGILLMCNERGYPLRWKVLGGRTKDPKALSALVDELEDVDWVKHVPIVFDRAMGSAGAVARLVQSGLSFLTATRRPEIASYTDALPTEVLSALEGSEDEAKRKRTMAEAARLVAEAGMHRVHETLYVLDLGVCERQLTFARPTLEAGEADVAPEELEGGALWLWQAREYQRQLADKVFSTRAQIAKKLGVSRARITQVMNLLRLDEALQQEVLAGHFGYIPDQTLRAIAKLKGKAVQRRALVEHAATARPMGGKGPAPRPRKVGRLCTKLRLVAYFNPQMFADQRTVALRHLGRVQDFCADLNRKLRSRGGKRTRESVQVEVTNKLASLSLLSVYDVQVVEQDGQGQAAGTLQVQLTFDEAAWARRRRFDGFVLLAGHPELSHSGLELVQLYRDKDAVEKDFQTIKTDLKLRPVFHHTDPKVRAHVTLCMLALLLERTLERRLRRTRRPMTAPACFEVLASGHLNMLATDPDLPTSYLVTDPDSEQQALLRSLRLGHLVQQQEVAARLHPRTATAK